MWTITEWLAFLGALGALCGVLGANILLVLNGLKQLRETLRQSHAETTQQLVTIHKQTNDQLDRVETRSANLTLALAEALREVMALKIDMARIAVTGSDPRPPPPPPPTPPSWPERSRP